MALSFQLLATKIRIIFGISIMFCRKNGKKLLAGIFSLLYRRIGGLKGRDTEDVGGVQGRCGREMWAEWEKGAGKVGGRYGRGGMEVRPCWEFPIGARLFTLGRKIFCPVAQDFSPQGKRPSKINKCYSNVEDSPFLSLMGTYWNVVPILFLCRRGWLPSQRLSRYFLAEWYLRPDQSWNPLMVMLP